MAKTLSIGEVAQRTGLRPSALRYYEEAGVLPAPARVSGRRRYDSDALRRIDLLRFAQQAGFTLEEIRALFSDFGAETPLSVRWRLLARRKVSELDEVAEHVRRMKEILELSLKCDCARLKDCSLSPADVSRVRLHALGSRGGTAF
jgi:MerR family redox-sensitive transcriptional activator SoxR